MLGLQGQRPNLNSSVLLAFDHRSEALHAMLKGHDALAIVPSTQRQRSMTGLQGFAAARSAFPSKGTRVARLLTHQRSLPSELAREAHKDAKMRVHAKGTRFAFISTNPPS